MATYDFETITPDQALFIAAADTIRVASGAASQSAVLYDTSGHIVITIGARTVVFGQGVAALMGTTNNRFIFPDGSQLYAGDQLNNNFQLNAGSALAGGAYGGGGDDTFLASSGSWLVQGNQGYDRITLPFGANTVYGGQDDDQIRFGGASSPGGNFANGNKGSDVMAGSGGMDTLLGGQGGDTLDGFGGQDILNGNLGDDLIIGAGQILGEGGNDTINADTVLASTISGGDGDDRITIRAQGGRDSSLVVTGDEGNDLIDTDNPGSETLSAGAGDDFIYSLGNTRGDLLDGGAGNDFLLARGGSNILLGGDGADKIEGGEGGDTINGGAGFDTLAGGFGADLFIETDGVNVQFVIATTLNRITHWEVSDHIQLRGAITAQQYVETSAENLFVAQNTAETALANGAEVVAVQVGADVVIYTDVSAGTAIHNVILLAGRTLADVSSDNFV